MFKIIIPKLLPNEEWENHITQDSVPLPQEAKYSVCDAAMPQHGHNLSLEAMRITDVCRAPFRGNLGQLSQKTIFCLSFCASRPGERASETCPLRTFSFTIRE